MLCPGCRAGCAVDDIFCRRCGADLSIPSKSLISTEGTRLPAVLHNSPLPRVAAGVGALAFGVGIELLRRSLVARLARPAKVVRASSPGGSLGDLLTRSRGDKSAKLPRGYEMHEVVVYMSRVIRRDR